MYAGQDKILKKGNLEKGIPDVTVDIKENESPINFFDPDLKKYPLC